MGCGLWAARGGVTEPSFTYSYMYMYMRVYVYVYVYVHLQYLCTHNATSVAKAWGERA